MVLINALVLALVYNFCQKFVSPPFSFLITLSLLITNQFWFASQYSLNPHILPILTFGLVISLLRAYQGRKQGLIVASICTGLVLHSELAFIPIALITLIFSTILIIKKNKYPYKVLIKPTLILLFFSLPHLISEIIHNFLQIKSVIRAIQEPTGIIGTASYLTRLSFISQEFITLFSQLFIPQNKVLGIIIILISLFILIWGIQQKKFNKSYIFILKITLLIIILSLLWFSLSKEFLPWHMLGVYPLVLIISLIGLVLVRNKLAVIIFSLITLSQVINFITIYSNQLTISTDQGILANKIKTVDWIYQQADNQGFYLYTYINYVYDYSYQYTIWWQGTTKYQYLPCEYSTYPGTSSSLYFSPIKYYQQPQKQCTNTRFLIIEPTKDKQGFNTWYQGITENTTLLQTTNIGNITVEKREIN